MKQNEMTNLVTKLSDRIDVLEHDLKKTKKTYSAALTKLFLKMKKLEKQVTTGKARRRAKIILSEDEDVVEDSSKQGRKISDIDEDPNIFLAQDNEVNWFQEETEDAQVQQKKSDDTEVFLEEGEPTEVVQDQGSGEKGQPEVTTASFALDTAGVSISTAGVQISTASTIHSIAGMITYSRRSVEKRKYKGKAIMEEPEPQKMSKKQLEQERLSFEEAIRLQEQTDEEERAQIARDKEIARQLEEQERQRVVIEATITK
ncbi:hypothetical protein Tco_0987288 [Tanacetum coccineum]